MSFRGVINREIMSSRPQTSHGASDRHNIKKLQGWKSFKKPGDVDVLVIGSHNKDQRFLRSQLDTLN